MIKTRRNDVMVKGTKAEVMRDFANITMEFRNAIAEVDGEETANRIVSDLVEAVIDPQKAMQKSIDRLKESGEKLLAKENENA